MKNRNSKGDGEPYHKQGIFPDVGIGITLIGLLLFVQISWDKY